MAESLLTLSQRIRVQAAFHPFVQFTLSKDVALLIVHALERDERLVATVAELEAARDRLASVQLDLELSRGRAARHFEVCLLSLAFNSAATIALGLMLGVLS